MPFRMRWFAFWYGFFHPFNTNEGRERAAREIYEQYKHLIGTERR
jgi:hypothetical protein